jgi:hypothetical protein
VTVLWEESRFGLADAPSSELDGSVDSTAIMPAAQAGGTNQSIRIKIRWRFTSKNLFWHEMKHVFAKSVFISLFSLK